VRAEDDEGAPLGRALVAGPYIAGSPQAVRAISAVVALGRAAPELIPGGAAAAGLDPRLLPSRTHGSWACWPEAVRGAAAGLDVSGRIPGRRTRPLDRREEPCLTIDSAETRDLDDAVAATWDGDAASPVHVAIHIADVAGAVGIGSEADLYARTVASTAYLAVGANAPMLDPALSEGSLSLLPNEYRHVISVRFDVLADGSIGNVDVETALIESRARLTYGAVEKWLDDDHAPVTAEAGEHAEVARAVLDAALEASRRLGVERDGRATFEELFADAEVTPALVDGRLAGRRCRTGCPRLPADRTPHGRCQRVRGELPRGQRRARPLPRARGPRSRIVWNACWLPWNSPVLTSPHWPIRTARPTSSAVNCSPRSTG
jgi:ribonuclease R